MTPEQFCYWLQGRAELEPAPPTAEQWQSIRDHLATVFVKVTPPVHQWTPRRDATGNPPTTLPYTVECFAALPAVEGATYC